SAGLVGLGQSSPSCDLVVQVGNRNCRRVRHSGKPPGLRQIRTVDRRQSLAKCRSHSTAASGRLEPHCTSAMNHTTTPVTEDNAPVTTTTGQPAETYQALDPVAAETPHPVNARGLALTCVALVAVLYLMHWAAEFLVPMALGIMLAYT